MCCYRDLPRSADSMAYAVSMVKQAAQSEAGLPAYVRDYKLPITCIVEYEYPG